VEARDRYLRFLQRSLCAVSPSAIWRVAPVLRSPDGNQFSSVTVPDVVPLSCDDGSKLYLKAMQRFTYGDHPDHSGERKVNTLEYAYALTNDPYFNVALFSWEWNPSSEVWSDPHVHLSRGDPASKGYAKQHVPTGRVAFEHVLRFAILQHGVSTLYERDAALKMLSEILDRWNRHKSW